MQSKITVLLCLVCCVLAALLLAVVRHLTVCYKLWAKTRAQLNVIWTPGKKVIFVCSQAQQPVPDWLERVAFGAHGTTGYNPRGGVFASMDSRKVRFVIMLKLGVGARGFAVQFF